MKSFGNEEGKSRRGTGIEKENNQVIWGENEMECWKEYFKSV